MNGEATEWVRFDWSLPGNDFAVSIPQGYCIRPGYVEDLDAMQTLVGTAYASDPSWEGQTADIQRRVSERMRQRISDPTAYFALATFDGQVVGLNGVALKSATNMNLITGICVDPAHQGRGLGGVLLGATLSWLRDQGLPNATVTTDGRAVAARIYARFGAVRIANVTYGDAPKSKKPPQD